MENCFNFLRFAQFCHRNGIPLPKVTRCNNQPDNLEENALLSDDATNTDGVISESASSKCCDNLCYILLQRTLWIDLADLSLRQNICVSVIVIRYRKVLIFMHGRF